MVGSITVRLHGQAVSKEMHVFWCLTHFQPALNAKIYTDS